MRCVNCGKKLDEKYSFCTNCGFSIDKKSENLGSKKESKMDSDKLDFMFQKKNNDIFKDDVVNDKIINKKVVKDKKGKLKNIVNKKILLIILVVLIVSVILIFGLKSLGNKNLDISKDGNQTKQTFIGDWFLNEDGILINGNYFSFNSDGTFHYAKTDEGIYMGKYSYDKNIEDSDLKLIKKEENYTYYTFILKVENLIDENGNTVLDIKKKEFKFLIGINNNNKDMYAFNVNEKDGYYLRKQ